MTMMQPANGAPPTQQVTQMLKSADGKMRLDMPNMSVITNPAMQHALVLDHLKQEFKMIPIQLPAPNLPHPPGMPHLPGMPKMPALPQIPGMPHPPVMHAQDLGKTMLGGIPVEGKQFSLHMPTLPALPKAPQLPGMPKAPGLPGMPQAPGAPQVPGMPKPPALPKPPIIAQVWSSPVTGMPVMSKITGEFGTQTMQCQTAPVPEPHPSMFQPPPNYKFTL